MLRQIVFISLLLAACCQATAADRPFSGAQLIEQLPSETLLYVRIPHPNGLLATAKGNALDPVLSNPDRARMADEIIRSAFERLGRVEPEIIAPFSNLMNDIRSPVEVAVISTPGPVSVMSFVLPHDEDSGFEAWFANLAAMVPDVTLSLSQQQTGFYAIDGSPAPAFSTFDAQSGSVKLLVGQALDAAGAERVIQMLDGAGEISTEIAAIDESDQGLVAWINVEQSLPMAQLFIPLEDYEMLQQLGIETMRSIQLGIGVAKGRSTLSFGASLLPGVERKLPVFEHELGATAAGALEMVGQLAVPSERDWNSLEQLIENTIDGEAWTEWQYIKTTLADAYGLDFALMTRALGPDFTFIVDSVGEYVAVRVRDEAAYRQWLARLEAVSHVEFTTRRIGRQTVNAVAIREHESPLDEQSLEIDEQARRWAAVVMDMKDRSYWIEEDGYLYFSGLPQPLMARARERKRVQVGEWLRDERGADLSSALMGVTWNTRHLPRRLYHTYLNVLQLLADVGQVSFDVFDMPTANALKLPTESAMGIVISMGQDSLGLEITSESSPLDFLFGGGAGTASAAAVTGVLAAIAIPAYQDYSIRAEVSERLYSASGMRSEIDAFYAENGRFPNAEEAEILVADFGLEWVRLVPGEPVIEVGFDPIEANEALIDAMLVLSATTDDSGELEWSCAATLEEKYLPTFCRDGVLPEGY
ncbi:MAG: pilin [Pseudomonadota bacterium]